MGAKMEPKIAQKPNFGTQGPNRGAQGPTRCLKGAIWDHVSHMLRNVGSIFGPILTDFKHYVNVVSGIPNGVAPAAIASLACWVGGCPR